MNAKVEISLEDIVEEIIGNLYQINPETLDADGKRALEESWKKLRDLKERIGITEHNRLSCYKELISMKDELEKATELMNNYALAYQLFMDHFNRLPKETKVDIMSSVALKKSKERIKNIR
jgi:CBS domain containing-hemolysin-like protein